MKKLLCVIICLLIPLCFVGCKDSGETEEVQPVELTSRSLTEGYEFAVVDEKGKVWLENDDVQSVLVMYEKGKDRYLELRFTKKGAKQFKKAVKKNKNGTLSITLDGEILASGVVANEKTPEYANVNGVYDDVIGWFNKLTCE